MNWKNLSVVLAACLACHSPAWCQEEQPTKAELQALEKAINDEAHVKATWENALIDLSASLIADNGLGIDVALADPALRAQLGLEDNIGLVVTAAPEESLGAKAGLRVHDVLVQFDKQKLGDAQRLADWLRASDGKSVKLRLLRGGKPLELQVVPKKPDAPNVWLQLAAKDYLVASSDGYRLGVQLSEADDTLRAHLRLAADEGLIVTEVVKDSAASAAGIRTNDVLIVLDGKRLTKVEAINAQIQEIKDRLVELRLLRGGEERVLQITPRKSQQAAFIDRPVRFWDMKTCTQCHANPWGEEASHLLLADKLGANHSAWTDGHILRYYDKFRDWKTKPAAAAPPQKQIDALRAQLAEMQKTLTALEASLAEPKKEEKK